MEEKQQNKNTNIQDKSKFITDILDYSIKKKVDYKTQERLINLISKEFEKTGIIETEIIERIERIEGMLSGGNKTIKNNDIKSFSGKSNKFPEPNPKNVADFMSLFNQRDGLKYLTHDFDEEGEFSIDNFLTNAKTLFEKKTKELSIPISLWRISQQFAFFDKPKWTRLDDNYDEKKTITGWSTENWSEWSKINKLHPFRNNEFKEIIDGFKKLTRIERLNLEVLVNKCYVKGLGDKRSDFKITTKDLDKADFYTHVQFFKEALETIFEEIVKNTDSDNKKQISILYERESIDNYFVRKVIISHNNSFPPKELGILNNEWRTGKGNMGKIEEKLKGYCQWTV